MARATCALAVALLVGCGTRTELRETVEGGEVVSLCGIEADSGGGGACSGARLGLTCCGGTLENLENDPLNCGACGQRCAPGEMCLHAHCTPPTCAPSCGACQTCCLVNQAGPPGPAECVDGPTCPVGCPSCT